VRDEAYGWQLSNGRYIYRCPITGMYGTVEFMPPEQQADGIVAPASDIYTLGLTLPLLFLAMRLLEAHGPGSSKLYTNMYLSNGTSQRLHPSYQRLVFVTPTLILQICLTT
jgi:serine/threonine protein kinase